MKALKKADKMIKAAVREGREIESDRRKLELNSIHERVAGYADDINAREG